MYDINQIDITITTLLFLAIMFGAMGLAAILSWFNPFQLIQLIHDTKELKHIDELITHKVKQSGFITKIFFRIFSKNAERYFP